MKNDKIINIARFTYNAWMNTFPDSDVEEWEGENCPKNIIDFVIGNSVNYEECTGMDLGEWKLRIVTIDDEYLEWLNDNNLDNTKESIAKYMRIISDEKADELLNKNEMNTEDQLLFLRLAMFDECRFEETTNYVLNEEITKELHNYLSSIYKNSKIFVSHYLMTAERAAASTDELLNFANEYFETSSYKKSLKYTIQTHNPLSKNIAQLYIPFVIRNSYNKSIFKIGDVLRPKNCNDNLTYHPNRICFDRDILDIYEKYDIEEICESTFFDLLYKYLACESVLLYSSPRLVGEIEDLHELLMRYLDKFSNE